MSSELWKSEEPPLEAIMAMAAVEAASFQDPRIGKVLDAALREAVFERGLDIARDEVVLDIARSVAGRRLCMSRFHRDLLGPGVGGWRERLLDRSNAASAAGVDRVPCVYVQGRALAGDKEVNEYVEAMLEALARTAIPGAVPLV